MTLAGDLNTNTPGTWSPRLTCVDHRVELLIRCHVAALYLLQHPLAAVPASSKTRVTYTGVKRNRSAWATSPRWAPVTAMLIGTCVSLRRLTVDSASVLTGGSDP